MNKKYKVSLFPHKIIPVISMQDTKQIPGWQITDFDFPSVWSKCAGEGVNVAILDSGSDLQHEDLKNNLIPGPNFVKRTDLPNDDNCHGSHTSSIVCAENNDLGILGVAYKAKVTVVKILDNNGIGTLENVVAAIKWCLHNHIDIISMSLGSPNDMPKVHDAINMAYKQNVPVFVAAGNAGKQDKLFYPANFKEAISVSSVDRDLKKSNFSNTAHNIDFFCPGRDILGAIPTNAYGTLSGTSQATPWLAGVAALMLSYKRNHQTDMKLDSVEDYRHTIKQFCKPINDKCLQGSGLFDPKLFAAWAKDS